MQVADLRALATLAEEEGIAIGYEALAWGTHVNRWQQAWERVRRVDSPALGLVLDSFHILARGDTLDALPSVPVEKITFVQLADAPYMKMDLLEWSRHFRCFPGQGSCRWRRLPSRSPAVATAAPGRWRSSMTVFRASPNGATAQRWLSFAAVAGGANPPSAPDVRCRSVFTAAAAGLSRAGVYRVCRQRRRGAAPGATSAGAGFSARGKPPLQTGDAVAQRRGADRHQPSAAQLGRPFLSTPRGIALRDGAAGRAQRVACRPRPRAGVCHLAGATPGRTKRRSRRSAPPTAALSISSTPGRLSTSAIFICVMA
ncbi:4-hydroxyphenylpyruvate dioxygenase [Klebsiella pneumoniae]|uniref:4-hydroxyphenylpyruvate dioxygenase n=1 Tax=Klebsiella pneumoniae TaxID=573 RepID=A0A377W2Q8_KLEPN|nr:4-hydroxyphenylpyruvate dioxygenase [Klebsiella pneumoniae]